MLSSNFAPSRLFNNSNASRGLYSRSLSTLAFCSNSFLPTDRYPHAPRRSLYNPRGSLKISSVQVWHLRTGYLLDLRSGNTADLRTVWLAATLLDPGSLP